MSQISVIVPVYKVEAYLPACIDSILAQTFTDFELILIDDGSPDHCGTICDEYAKKDVRIHVIHQENGGLSAARNAGIDWVFENSDSQWITFVDSDDLIHPKYLEYLLSMVQNTGAQISTCGMLEFSEESDVPDSNFDLANNTFVYTGINAALNQYKERSKIGVSACGKLYQTSLFSNIRYPIGKLHEDQAVTPIVLSLAEAVAVSSFKLYYYRFREQSIMHNQFSIKRYDDIESVDACIHYFQKNGMNELVSAAERRKQMLLSVYTLYSKKNGILKAVPEKYRMSEYQALKWLYNNLSNSMFTYQLAKVHPDWVRPHEYLRKIKKILHIPYPS